ncbi:MULTISPECIES: hypothetical protein [unclassified Frankia]|nr:MULTISPECIES: hypothetical protein [unclassified Frankia]
MRVMPVRQPEPRTTSPSVTFLAVPAASFITGSGYVIDGGQLR